MSSVICRRCGAYGSGFDARCTKCGEPLPHETGEEVLDGAQAPPAARPVDDPRIGTTIGHYRIVAPLGAGGMGVVYRAEDTRLGRAVAIKFPNLSSDSAAKSRFLREARALSALDHQNVGTIYELAEHAGAPYLALALYEGETLFDRIGRSRQPVDEVVWILTQMAAGLAAAHQAGIVHRDIKPANVMLPRSGPLKLLDFGLAKLISAAIGSGSVLTKAGAVLGTVAYCSPEQIVGDGVDHRTDLWSLGVIGYEMLAGVRPFEAATRSGIALKVFTEEPVPLAQRRPDVDVRVASVVAQLLVKRPDDRIQHAAEVAAWLQASPAR